MANESQVLTFEVYRGDSLIKTGEFSQTSITIGKGDAAALQISDDSIGDLHAVINVAADGALTIADLGADGINEIMHAADSFAEVCARPIPKVPALRGKTVASMFFEDSTRTRTSFETAAKRLSADVMNFSASSSSVNKGESLRDTVETIEAMGVDAIVVRHKSSGAPQQIAR